jgi:hypothetical protein
MLDEQLHRRAHRSILQRDHNDWKWLSQGDRQNAKRPAVGVGPHKRFGNRGKILTTCQQLHAQLHEIGGGDQPRLCQPFGQEGRGDQIANDGLRTRDNPRLFGQLREFDLADSEIAAARRFSSGNAEAANVLSFAQPMLDSRGHLTGAQFAAASQGGLEHAAMIEIAALIAINVFTNSVSSLACIEAD